MLIFLLLSFSYHLSIPTLVFTQMGSLKGASSITRILSRKFSTKYDTITIPMPWGNIAGKWWGPKDVQPILMSHGWQDNCGTFDTLLPFLPKEISFLIYDFPGHGMSSKLPPGICYHSIDGAGLLRRIIQYFNWPKVALLGHSMGSAISFIYTMLYPETVKYLICLDAFKPHIPNNQINRISKGIDDFLKYDNLNSIGSEPPSYTFQVMERILHEGTHKQIDLASSKYILERNVRPSSKDPSKVYFSRDVRLKTNSLMNWSQKVIIANLNRLTCPILLYTASNSPAFENKQKYFEAIEVLKKLNKDFETYSVEGSHHVHLNNPERVAGLINAFLHKYAINSSSSFEEKDSTS